MNKIFKLFLSIATLVLVSTSFAYAEEQNFSNHDEFTGSPEYSSICSLESQTLEELEEIIEIDHGEIPSDFPTSLDYSKISKVYVDTGIEKITSSDQSDIESILAQSKYVWVLPIDVGGIHYKITYSISSGLNPEAADILTDEEKQELTKKEGNWVISEIGEYSIEAYSDVLSGKLAGTSIDRAVLIGGIPGCNMPVALGFSGTEAVAWISLGFDSEILESIPQTRSGGNGVYDYSAVLQKMNTYEVDVDSTGGGSSVENSSRSINTTTRIAVVVGSVVFILILVMWIYKKRIKNC